MTGRRLRFVILCLLAWTGPAVAHPGATELLTGSSLPTGSTTAPNTTMVPVTPPVPEPTRPTTPVHFAIGDGLMFTTPDEDFELRIRLMQQTDAKLFLPTGQDPARSGLYIPRFRTYFEGRFTRSFEYELSIQRSVEGSFDVLDANVTYTPSEQFQVRFGRSIVPYSYEWYDHLEQYFIAPERGLFPLNFGLSRQAGITFTGRVLEETVQYAIGGFSGQIAGLADTNTTRDAVGYVNIRPFLHNAGLPRLKNFYVGGSVALGEQAFAADPLPLRTAIQSSENDEAARGASAVFLDYKPGVVASGIRRQASAHLAWYEGGWSLETEGHVGRFGFQRADGFGAEVPVAGWSLALARLVTGEVVERRTVIVPVRPFDPVNGHWGPGAIEPFGRYSRLQIGTTVFDADLADPDDWSNRASTIDIGVNWYPIRYLKLTCDWQHSRFGSPVLINEQTGKKSRTNDLLWFRAQVNF